MLKWSFGDIHTEIHCIHNDYMVTGTRAGIAKELQKSILRWYTVPPKLKILNIVSQHGAMLKIKPYTMPGSTCFHIIAFS